MSKTIPFLWIKSDKYKDYRSNPSRVISIDESGYSVVECDLRWNESGATLAPGTWEYDLEAIRAEIVKTMTATECLNRLKEIL